MNHHAPHPRWSQVHGGADGRLHVLVETSDAVAEISDFAAFQEAGMQVAVCSQAARAAETCPLVHGGRCELADQADAVLIELGSPGETTCRLLHELAAQHPDLPLVVAAPPGAPSAEAALPRRVIGLPMPASVNEQVRVVRRAAIDGRHRRDQGQAARSDPDHECRTFT